MLKYVKEQVDYGIQIRKSVISDCKRENSKHGLFMEIISMSMMQKISMLQNL